MKQRRVTIYTDRRWSEAEIAKIGVDGYCIFNRTKRAYYKSWAKGEPNEYEIIITVNHWPRRKK